MSHLAQSPVDAPNPLIAGANCAYVTPAGKIYLRDRCSNSFLEQLKPDAGLHAFAHQPEREHELLLKIAGSEQGEVAVAYTSEGVIVGQITFTDAGAWWKDVGVCREVAIEVSENWRKRGVAHQLMKLLAGREDLEDRILLAMGFSWHWDTRQLGINIPRYREMLEQMVAPYGFTEYLTAEPNIRDHPFNILLARLGSRVEAHTLSQFYNCLLRTETLPGL